MDWTRFALVVVSAGTITTITDYLLTGGWIQKRFADPEIWRTNNGGIPGTFAAFLPFFTCGVFAFTANRMQLTSLHLAIKFALAVWAMGPLTLILTDATFIKLSKQYIACYALAWFIKLMVVALLVAHFLR